MHSDNCLGLERKIFRSIAPPKGKIKPFECTRTAAMANKLENINCQEREQMVSHAFKSFHNIKKENSTFHGFKTTIFSSHFSLCAFIQAIVHYIFHIHVFFCFGRKCEKKTFIRGKSNTTLRIFFLRRRE